MKNKAFLLAFAALFLASCASSSKLFLKGNAPTETYAAEMPIQLVSNIIIMPLEINGKTYRFLFDTGAPMVISEELKAELQCKRVSRKYVTDSQGVRNKQDYVQLEKVSIAGHSFENLTAIAVDLNKSAVLRCLQLDGIIGANLMRFAIWKIDYENQKIYFTNNPEGYEIAENAIEMNFETKATFTPTVDLQLDSVWLKNVTFDTGSGSGLSVSKNSTPDLTNHPYPKLTSYGYHSAGIYGSATDSTTYTFYPVKLNEETTSEILLSVSNKRGKSLLGGDFFKNYNVILNWDKKQAVLNPIENPSQERLMLGFSAMYQNDTLIVGAVVENSLAAELGFAFNDVIEQVNHVNCVEFNHEKYCEVRDIFADKKNPVTVHVRNKGAHTFMWVNMFEE